VTWKSRRFRLGEQDCSEINGQRNIFLSCCDPLQRAIRLATIFSTADITKTNASTPEMTFRAIYDVYNRKDRNIDNKIYFYNYEAYRISSFCSFYVVKVQKMSMDYCSFRREFQLFVWRFDRIRVWSRLKETPSVFPELLYIHPDISIPPFYSQKIKFRTKFTPQFDRISLITSLLRLAAFTSVPIVLPLPLRFHADYFTLATLHW